MPKPAPWLSAPIAKPVLSLRDLVDLPVVLVLPPGESRDADGTGSGAQPTVGLADDAGVRTLEANAAVLPPGESRDPGATGSEAQPINIATGSEARPTGPCCGLMRRIPA